MLESFSIQTFSEQLETGFRLQYGESEAIEAQLIEVIDNGTSPDQERFSLVFRVPRNDSPTQGLYDITHEKLGQFTLLLVPIRQDKQGMYYEAVFNRLREAQ